MYDDIVKRLRDAAKMSDALAVLLPHSEGNATAKLYREAADAIEEMSRDLDSMNEANIALYGALPNWIPVSERLPEIRKVVLITDGIDVGTGWMNQGWWNTSFADIQRDAVTHWMPLPEPPKEE